MYFAHIKILDILVMFMDSKRGQNMPEVFRRFLGGLTGRDRRNFFSVHALFFEVSARRKTIRDRRPQIEWRDRWVRISK